MSNTSQCSKAGRCTQDSKCCAASAGGSSERQKYKMLEERVKQLEKLLAEQNKCDCPVEEEPKNPIAEVITQVPTCSCSEARFEDVIKEVPPCQCLERLKEKLMEKCSCKCDEFHQSKDDGNSAVGGSSLAEESEDQCPCGGVVDPYQCEEGKSSEDENDLEEADIDELNLLERIEDLEKKIRERQLCECAENIPKKLNPLEELLSTFKQCSCGEERVEKLLENVKECQCLLPTEEVKEPEPEKEQEVYVPIEDYCYCNDEPSPTCYCEENNQEEDQSGDDRVATLEKRVKELEDAEHKTEELKNMVDDMLAQFKQCACDADEVNKLIAAMEGRYNEKLKAVACECGEEIPPGYDSEECGEDNFDVMMTRLDEGEGEGEDYIFMPLEPISEEKSEEKCICPETSRKDLDCGCPVTPEDGGRSSLLAGFALEILKHCSVEEILGKLDAITAIEQKMNKIEGDIQNLSLGNEAQGSASMSELLRRAAEAGAGPVEEPEESQQSLQQEIEALKNELKEMKESKASLEYVDEKLAEKADAVMVEDKVSEKVFEDALEDLAKGIDDAGVAVQKLRNEIDEKDHETKLILDSKIDKADMDQMQEYFQSKMDKFRDKLKELAKIKKEAEGAAVRTKTIRDLRCLVCNADVLMKETGTHYYGPVPKGRCFEKRPKGKNGSIQGKKHSYPDSKGPKSVRRADSDFSLDEPVPRVVDVVSRFCGGSHTMTTPDQRVSRQPNIMDLLDY